MLTLTYQQGHRSHIIIKKAATSCRKLSTYSHTLVTHLTRPPTHTTLHSILQQEEGFVTEGCFSGCLLNLEKIGTFSDQL